MTVPHELVFQKQHPETGCSTSVWSVVEAHSQAMCEMENWEQMNKGVMSWWPEKRTHPGLLRGVHITVEQALWPGTTLQQPHSPA